MFFNDGKGTIYYGIKKYFRILKRIKLGLDIDLGIWLFVSRKIPCQEKRGIG